ncbi:uncharacterized protein LTR77_005662 [Saxophila tyrrhenica]|uniref:Protein YOP1 n=1 Tax=Saxophila tyrrhenica TaxID=1690608 RepID=A0AAV9PC49_9PEZI|nr:hypothetical protein LTR77_005662 [Saxophila tyrrhenica]
MFSFIADFLTGIISILFPVFASYKALRSSDPANLAPWLMYWTTLSLLLLVESQFGFLISWFPFYAWARLGLHLYLVLPGQQGSVFIYKAYIHPFLEEHERQIDRLISDLHAKAKAAGGDVVKQGWEYVRTQLLGQEAKQPSPVPSRNASYSSYLMDRFAMPSARQAAGVAAGGDLFGLIGKALQQTTYPDSTSREAQADDLTRSGNLIPPSLRGDERTDFIATQRERLNTLLRAFDHEAGAPAADMAGYGARDAAYSSSRSSMPRQPSSRKSYLAATDSPNMHKSRSESEFEDLAYEPMPDPEHYRPQPEKRPSSRRKGGGGGQAGWSNWIWGSYGEKDSAVDPRKDE